MVVTILLAIWAYIHIAMLLPCSSDTLIAAKVTRQMFLLLVEMYEHSYKSEMQEQRYLHYHCT